MHTGWKIARYRGPEGQAELEVSPAVHGGEPRQRDGTLVLSIWSRSIRWEGDRHGEPMSEADRDRILAAVREHFRRNDQPYEVVLPSGEVEDEHGDRAPGFASPLPRAEHSDGWAVEDLWLSPEYPDAARFPPTVVYRDPVLARVRSAYDRWGEAYPPSPDRRCRGGPRSRTPTPGRAPATGGPARGGPD